MNEHQVSLLLGIFQNVLYILVASSCTILLRISKLPPQIYLAYLFVGNFVTTIPIFAAAKNNWYEIDNHLPSIQNASTAKLGTTTRFHPQCVV